MQRISTVTVRCRASPRLASPQIYDDAYGRLMEAVRSMWRGDAALRPHYRDAVPIATIVMGAGDEADAEDDAFDGDVGAIAHRGAAHRRRCPPPLACAPTQ